MLKPEFPIKDKKKGEKEMKRKRRKGKEGFPIEDRKKVKRVILSKNLKSIARTFIHLVTIMYCSDIVRSKDLSEDLLFSFLVSFIDQELFCFPPIFSFLLSSDLWSQILLFLFFSFFSFHPFLSFHFFLSLFFPIFDGEFGFYL